MNEINLKSENLLDVYKENEREISRLQFTVVEQKIDLEKTELYKSIKEKEQKIKELQAKNEEYKSNVKDKMLDSGLKSLETFTHKITLGKTVGSLKIFDENIVPQLYIKEVKPIFDNAKIKKDIKDGNIVPGCEVVEGWSLSITEK